MKFRAGSPKADCSAVGAPRRKFLKCRERVAGARGAAESKRTADGKVVEAIQLILNRFTAHAQAVLAGDHRKRLDDVVGVRDRAAIVVDAGSQREQSR